MKPAILLSLVLLTLLPSVQAATDDGTLEGLANVNDCTENPPPTQQFRIRVCSNVLGACSAYHSPLAAPASVDWYSLFAPTEPNHAGHGSTRLVCEGYAEVYVRAQGGTGHRAVSTFLGQSAVHVGTAEPRLDGALEGTPVGLERSQRTCSYGSPHSCFVVHTVGWDLEWTYAGILQQSFLRVCAPLDVYNAPLVAYSPYVPLPPGLFEPDASYLRPVCGYVPVVQEQ